MKHLVFGILFLASLQACTTLKSLQTVTPTIPDLGAVGTLKDGLFEKTYQTVSTPNFSIKVPVDLQLQPFTKNQWASYVRSQERKGVKVQDSLPPHNYLELHLADLVSVAQILNEATNVGLRTYLADDASLSMVSAISIRPTAQQEKRLLEAHRIQLVQDKGQLKLALENEGGVTHMLLRNLDSFNFKTSSFCWKQNRRGQPEIALIVPNGAACPSHTEKKAQKVIAKNNALKP